MGIWRSLRKEFLLFDSYFHKGQICHTRGRGPPTTAHMRPYGEPLHGHPDPTVAPRPLEWSHLCVQSIKAPPRNKQKKITNRWLGRHFWPSCWKSWLLDSVKITGWGLEEAHERWQAVTFPVFHFMANASFGLGGWLRACCGARGLDTEKAHAKTAGCCWWALLVCKGLCSEELGCLLPRQALVSQMRNRYTWKAQI